MQVTLALTNSGRILTLTAINGRIIAEILVHGSLSDVLSNCLTEKPITKGRANIFRGELFQLAGYEVLDTENERIIEK